MNTEEKSTLLSLAESLAHKFDSIHERSRPLMDLLGDSGGSQRVLLVSALELGYVAEELYHIAVKTLGINPVICRVETFNLDSSLVSWAVTYPEDSRQAAAATIMSLADDALAQADVHFQQSCQRRPGDAGRSGAGGDALVTAHTAEPEQALSTVLPSVEASVRQLDERRRSFRTALPASLATLALMECVERLVKRCDQALAVAKGTNPFALPDSEQLQSLYAEAVREANLAGIFLLTSLLEVTSAEFASFLDQALDLSSAGTRRGYVMAAARTGELAARALSLAETAVATK